jgi:uncharacterized protein YjeT (DUF2065 family)
MKFFLCVLGVAMIIEGIPYFAFPAKMKEWMRRVDELPENVLQTLGVVIMLIGILLVVLGRR